MTAKTPTPQGISALLRKAGFTKAVVRRHYITCPGYHVSKPAGFPAGAVQVNHWTGSSSTFRQDREMLSRYAEAIAAAGYSIKADDWDLIITAGER
jgi:hypothetical protein